MYVRTISRKNKDVTTTTYVQLAHNVRDTKGGNPLADVLYTFGRADSLDVNAIRRLVRSLCGVLSPEDALRAQVSPGRDNPLQFVRITPLEGAYLLPLPVGKAGDPQGPGGMPEGEMVHFSSGVGHIRQGCQTGAGS